MNRDGKVPTAVAGGIIGGIGGLALSLTSDVINGEDVDWKRGFKNAALGAAIGSGLAFVSLPTVAMQVSEYKMLVGMGSLFGVLCNISKIPEVNALFAEGKILESFGVSFFRNGIAGGVSSLLASVGNILEDQNVSHMFAKAGLSGIIQAIASGFLGNIFTIAASEITGNTVADRFSRQITNNVLGNGLYGYGMGTYISSLAGEKAFPDTSEAVN